MADTLQALIQDTDLVAITFRQTLAPVEGPGTPIFPATCPAPERGQHRFDTPLYHQPNQGWHPGRRH
jgi:hypothetical protein